MDYHPKGSFRSILLHNYVEYLLRDRSLCLMTDHANLVYINKSTNMMVSRWKTALGSYDFIVKHIQGVKNIVADYLSRLVKNYMVDEVLSNDNIPEVAKDAVIISMLHHEMNVPDEAWLKIKDVHKDVSGHSGVEATMARLFKAHKPWVYIRNHVRHFVQTCAACQKMSTIPREINSIP